MNTLDILHNGHRAILHSVSQLDWCAPHAASIKDTLVQMAAFEQVMVEVLTLFVAHCPTPALDMLLAGYDVFSDRAIRAHHAQPMHEVWAEYEAAHAQTIALLALIPAELRHQPGTLPWYDPEFTLDDFILYTFFGTKRKWSVQLNTWRRTRHTA